MQSVKLQFISALALALMTLALGIAGVSPAHAQANPAIECRVLATTENPGNWARTSMDGNVIAWYSGSGVNTAILYADRRFNEVRNVSLFPAYDYATGIMLIGTTDALNLVMVKGRYILYTGRRPSGLRHLFLHDIDAGRTTVLTTGSSLADSTLVNFSFDGATVAWTQNHTYTDVNGSYTVTRLNIYRVDTGTRIMVPHNGQETGRYNMISPVINGDQIMYTHVQMNNRNRFLYNLKTGITQPLDFFASEYTLTDRWIVYVTNGNGLYKKSLSNLAQPGILLNQQVRDTTGLGHPAWVVDGSRVVWADGQTNMLMSADLDSTAPPQVIDLYSSLVGQIQLSGRWLTVVESAMHGQGRVFQYDLRTMTRTTVEYPAFLGNAGSVYSSKSGKFTVFQHRISADLMRTTVTTCNTSGTAVAPAVTSRSNDAVSGMDDGGLFSLSIGVRGTPPFRYQWYRGNRGDTSQPINGAQRSSLRLNISDLQLGENRFWVRITNSVGRVDSEAITKHILPQTHTYFTDFLFDNPDFESRELGGWRVRNGTQDRVMCNTETREVAVSGDCSFVFRGSPGENSRLQQKFVPQGDFGWAYGTGVLSIEMSYAMRQQNPHAVLRVVVKYSDGTRNTSAQVRLSRLANYQPLLVRVDSPNVSEIVVMINHKSAQGRLTVDDFYAFFYPDANSGRGASLPNMDENGVLELPAPPSFRGAGD